MYSTSFLSEVVDVRLVFVNDKYSVEHCAVPYDIATHFKKNDFFRYKLEGNTKNIIFEIFQINKTVQSITLYLKMFSADHAWIHRRLQSQPASGVCQIVFPDFQQVVEKFKYLPQKSENIRLNDRSYQVKKVIWDASSPGMCFPILSVGSPYDFPHIRRVKVMPAQMFSPCGASALSDPSDRRIENSSPTSLGGESGFISESDSDSDDEDDMNTRFDGQPGHTLSRSDSYVSTASYVMASTSSPQSPVIQAVVDPESPMEIRERTAKAAKARRSIRRAVYNAYRAKFHLQAMQANLTSRSRTLHVMTALQCSLGALPVPIVSTVLNIILEVCTEKVKEEYNKNDLAVIKDKTSPAFRKMQAATHFNMQAMAEGLVQDYWDALKYYKELRDIEVQYSIAGNHALKNLMPEKVFNQQFLPTYAKWRAVVNDATETTELLNRFSGFMAADFKTMQESMQDLRRNTNIRQTQINANAAQQKKNPSRLRRMFGIPARTVSPA